MRVRVPLALQDMKIVNDFEYIKKFIGGIRKDMSKQKISFKPSLCINNKFFKDEELKAILYFEGVIKKICKLNEIIYI